MKKKHVLAMALLLTAISISTQAKATETVVPVGSTFENLSGTTPGAVFSVAIGDSLIINESTKFLNNQNSTHGGAICSKGDLAINGATFDGNMATTNYAMGGAIITGGVVDTSLPEAQWTFAGSADIKNSTFKNNKASNGGAIYNQNRLTVDNTKFIGNEILGHNDAFSSGAAIDNSNRTTSVMHVTNSYFEGNKNGTAYGGGAIYFGTLSDELSYVKDSEFVENDSTYRNTATGYVGTGGAINIENGNFLVENSKFSKNKSDQGGAIYNQVANVDVIGSTFTENNATDGGAIFTESKMDISGSTFTENTTNGGDGGAIKVYVQNDPVANLVTITDSTFTKNHAVGSGADSGAISIEYGNVNISGSTFSENTSEWGAGAVFAYTTSGDTTIKDSEFTENSSIWIGAVGNFSRGTMTVENTKFIKNEATANNDDGGGAMYLGSESTTFITGSTFEGNTSATSGGAIGTRYASAGTTNKDASFTISDSTFTNNIATTTGGAIDTYFYNGSSVVNSTFESNKAAQGGAIFNHGDSDATGGTADLSISGSTFTGNTADCGGAVYTESKLNISQSSFEGNEATTSDGGGAIVIAVTNDVANNLVTVTSSTFTGNKANAAGADGGAISIQGGNVHIDDSTFTANESDCAGAIYARIASGDVLITNSTFEGNKASDLGAVANFSKNGIMTIDATTFKNNEATGQGSGNDGGGALFLGAESTTFIIDSTFEGNTSAGVGGAIATRDNVKGDNGAAKLTILDTSFSGNTADGNGGAVYNTFTDTLISNATFDGNTSGGNGGAIYNEVAKTSGDVDASINVTDTSFTNNSASGNGGAIYGTGDVNISAQNSNVVFSGNSAADGGDIYMAEKQDGTTGTLAMYIASDKSVSLEGGVSGASEFDMSVQGGGTLDVQSSINNAAVRVEGSTLHLNTGSDISGVKSIMLANGSTLDTRNNQVDDFASVAGLVDTDGSSTTVSADVNMNTGVGDNIGQLLKDVDNNSVSTGTPHIIVIDQINAVASGATSDNVSIDLISALGLANNENVTQVGINTENTVINDVMTPIRRLSGSIDNDGVLNYAPTGNSYNDFNSAVMVAPIAAQVGGYLNQLQSYDEAFMNMDMYMLMTKEQRLAKKYANKYAVNESSLSYQEPYAAYAQKSGFFRPYATMESVRLDNGPKVSNVAWGTYAGLESELYELGNDWDAMFSVYAGYNGSHQAYQGNSIYQNGGTLGATGVAYKGNFFTGLTANIGSNVADADTKYGSEDFAMLMTGVASKTGYNFEMAEGKFIVQPSLLMAYTMVNTFDYTNAAGVNINTDALHAFTFEPGVKFIGNLKNGWQPYAGVSVVMNAMDDANFKANDTVLPKLTVKPYAKYGVGVKKSWGERFTGFLQAFVTSGGRDGIGFQGGFKWQLGKKVEKVQEPSEKKYIKAGSKSRTIS